VAFVEPWLQNQPAVQGPVTADKLSRSQYEPAVHAVNTELPKGQKFPAKQFLAVSLVEPAGQKYPPLHKPDAVDKPVELQYEPAGQIAETELPDGQT
jgi:hypothetical protein